MWTIEVTIPGEHRHRVSLLSVPAAATVMGVHRFLSGVRFPILPRLFLPQHPSHVLPRVLRPVNSSTTYCSGIIRSPFDDVQIPEISVTQYIFDAQEQFAGNLALVSTSLCGRIMFYRALCWRNFPAQWTEESRNNNKP